ncbi:MAG: archaeosortase/exosortase family protein, partial [Anaerolineae bacterium]|nr:archaeosortase/exosortase family protein [Anaerolineae bacterium]
MLTDEMHTITTPQNPHLPHVWLQRGMNLTLAGLWLWLYHPVFSYFAIIYAREDFRTNQLALIGVGILLFTQIRKGQIYLRLETIPHLYPPALALALGGSALYLCVERYIDINIISALLFGLASYGLTGLWLSPSRWRQGLPVALLLIGTLPFGEHLQTFVGYPVRVHTAAIVRNAVESTGLTSIGIDTILVFENGISKIDLPCSGVRSLWTGMLFFIAATWIERRTLNLRWLVSAGLFIGILFVVNLVRVGTLVVVGQVLGWTLFAEMLHIPLGILGFGLACASGLLMCRTDFPVYQQPRRTDFPVCSLLTPFLLGAVVTMSLIYTP